MLFALLVAAGSCAGAPQEAPAPSPSANRPPSESQVPSVEDNIIGPWYRRLGNPYHARFVAPVDLRNSSRLSSLIRGGNLYLSLSDALALALENNLDIEVQRFTRPTAQTETLRTKGGGINRGILYDIRELPAGVGGPGSPLLTTVGGSTPISTVPTNAVDLAPVVSTDNVLGITGTIPFSAGTPIPQFDPSLVGGVNYAHQTIPETNILISGARTLNSNTVGGNLGYTQGFSTGTALNVAFNSARLSSNSTRTEYNPFTSGSLGVNITQPLLQGFSISNNRRFIRVAKNEEKISDQLFRQQLLDTLSSVVRLYWDLVSLNEDVRVKRQALELAQKLYEDNKSQVEVGTLAPIEVKRAQAEVARSQEDLTNSTGLVLQQELILKNVLTRRGTVDPIVRSSRIIPSDTIQIPAQEPAQDVSSLLDVAYQNRPDLAQARLQVDNAQILLSGSKNALLPRLDLVASFQNNGLAGDANSALQSAGTVPTAPDPVFIGGYGSFLSQVLGYKYPSYSVGVNLTLPLRNRVAQADYVRDQIMERQTEARRQQLENQVRLEVEYALQNLERTRAGYDAAVQTRQLQEEALDAERQRYQVGASTTYLVIQEQRDLAQARTTEVVTEGNYAKARAALDRATGKTLDTYGISVDEAYRGQVSKAPSVPPNP
ncbi:MAG: outer rane efflux protein [Bryobacterales bacterium]|nr:outer rane efflux protein [Bryobacterales bacterium]